MPLTLVMGAGVASVAAHLLMQAIGNWWRGKEEHVLLEALLLSLGVTFAVYRLAGIDPWRGRRSMRGRCTVPWSYDEHLFTVLPDPRLELHRKEQGVHL